MAAGAARPGTPVGQGIPQQLVPPGAPKVERKPVVPVEQRGVPVMALMPSFNAVAAPFNMLQLQQAIAAVNVQQPGNNG